MQCIFFFPFFLKSHCCIAVTVFQFSNPRCIKQINKHFPDIQIVKGRARHPQSQGFIERGNGPFKEALQNWMQDNNTADWSIGCYIVQRQINLRPSESRSNQVPYECYYEVSGKNTAKAILGENIKFIRSEVGLQLIEGVLKYLRDNNPLTTVDDDKVREIIERGDALHDEDEKLLTREDKEAFGLDERVQALLQEILSEILDVEDEIEDDCSESEEQHVKKTTDELPPSQGANGDGSTGKSCLFLCFSSASSTVTRSAFCYIFIFNSFIR